MEDCYFFMTASCTKVYMIREHLLIARVALVPLDIAKKPGPVAFAPSGCPSNRAEIECYWEGHGGCKKVDCPFRHVSTEKPATNNNELPIQDAKRATHKRMDQAISSTPRTPLNAVVDSSHLPPHKSANSERLKSPTKRTVRPIIDMSGNVSSESISKNPLDFEVKSLDEIMREKRQRLEKHDLEPKVSIDSSFPPASGHANSPPRGKLVSMPTSAPTTTTTSSITGPMQSLPMPPPSIEEEDIDKQLAEIDKLINS